MKNKTNAVGEIEGGSEDLTQSASSVENNGSDESSTMGSVIMNTSGEWFAEVMAGQQAAADELGVKLEMVFHLD